MGDKGEEDPATETVATGQTAEVIEEVPEDASNSTSEVISYSLNVVIVGYSSNWISTGLVLHPSHYLFIYCTEYK